MQVTLTNIVDNTKNPDSDFLSSNGLSYLIELDKKRILFDAGDRGSNLLHNMQLLDIDTKTIDMLVLSHGHWDHTNGIPALIIDRGDDSPTLPVITHPHALKRRRRSEFRYILRNLIKYRWYNFGFPKVSKDIMDKLDFTLVTEPHELSPILTTTGEINEWKEKHSKSDKLKIKLDKKYVKDDILDDLSLVLNTKEGIVLILGCGHAGVLNICARAKELYPDQDIEMIIGGTHLVALSDEKDLEYVAKKLENDYKKPLLYFSHCTGKKAIKFLTKYFGGDIVRSFKVGDTLTFEC